MTGRNRRKQIRGPFEMRVLRVIRALGREMRLARVPISRWARASCLDRGHLHRLLRGQSRASIPTIGQLLDGAWACLGGPDVRLEMRLYVAGREVGIDPPVV